MMWRKRQRVESVGPSVPFIADDIMETFDHVRSEEVFKLFGEMGCAGQVISMAGAEISEKLLDVAFTALAARPRDEFKAKNAKCRHQRAQLERGLPGFEPGCGALGQMDFAAQRALCEAGLLAGAALDSAELLFVAGDRIGDGEPPERLPAYPCDVWRRYREKSTSSGHR
ncbi:hypothetical protein X737_36505 [Mesorhizobium sp. L48C026A00]|nr:hypothetical protein X737_36505 [Mesorhizobium sp. L48C026A00]